MERYRERTRTLYDLNIEYFRSLRERARDGTIVVKGDELPWEQNRNSRSKFYFHRQKPDTALMNVTMFVQDIQSHSGEHRHQGGVVIYVLEGEGWTTVDGVEHHWKKGDLLLLPSNPMASPISISTPTPTSRPGGWPSCSTRSASTWPTSWYR